METEFSINEEVFKALTTMNNREVGAWGECYARQFLEKKNYKIIEQNWRYSRYGEIDLICLYKRRLVFVEVKTRRTKNAGFPLEAVNKSKYFQIKKVANGYLMNNDHLFVYGFRFESVGILIEGGVLRIKHITQIGFL